ncbi:MAG: hypothetical protein V1660_01055 [archaeon]
MLKRIRFNDWYSGQLELEELILDGKIQPLSQEEVDEMEKRAKEFLSKGYYSKDSLTEKIKSYSTKNDRKK